MALKFPCEIIGWYFLPAVRRELATYLVKERDLSRKETAKRLGLTEAAVCYYLKSKRGKKFKFDKKDLGKIGEIADEIAGSRENTNLLFISKTCEICKDLRKNKGLCKLHRKTEKLVKCNICFGE